VQGLLDLAKRVGPAANGSSPSVASAVDFVLEGLYAQKKISRTDDRGYSAAEGAPRRGTTRREEPAVEESFQIPGAKKKYYN
jgi:magnesium chelatase subunit I